MTDQERRESVVLERELEYHERLYSGFAQSHFARAAVRKFRAHSAARILKATNAGRDSTVLSLGCGIADTELILCPYVKDLVGVDLSPSAIRQAQKDAARMGIRNASFIQGRIADSPGKFDVIIAIFFLHHLSDEALSVLPREVAARLKPGGRFYSLDPNINRLSGAIGRRLIPHLMKKYETEDERELAPQSTASLFQSAGFDVQTEMYDFGSTPLAGLFPGWAFGYRIARLMDDVILKVPSLNRLGSNFELIARLR